MEYVRTITIAMSVISAVFAFSWWVIKVIVLEPHQKDMAACMKTNQLNQERFNDSLERLNVVVTEMRVVMEDLRREHAQVTKDIAVLQRDVRTCFKIADKHAARLDHLEERMRG